MARTYSMDNLLTLITVEQVRELRICAGVPPLLRAADADRSPKPCP